MKDLTNLMNYIFFNKKCDFNESFLAKPKYHAKLYRIAGTRGQFIMKVKLFYFN